MSTEINDVIRRRKTQPHHPLLDPATALWSDVYCYYSDELWYYTGFVKAEFSETTKNLSFTLDDIVMWVQGSAVCPPTLNPSHFRWLMARTATGMVWGLFDGQRWILPPAVFEAYCGHLTSSSDLFELRLFDATHELYLWFDQEIRHGRFVTENKDGCEYTPMRQTYRLSGSICDRVEDGFSLVSTPEGFRQVLPGALPLGPFTEPDERFPQGRYPVELEVRRHFGYDGCSGGSELSLSRMSGLAWRGKPWPEML